MLQGQSYTVAHVGDTRVWRLIADQAGGEIQLLTQDHAYAHPDLRSRLTRAVGLDDVVRVDYLQGEARIGDSFVLTTDGVHGDAQAAPASAALAIPRHVPQQCERCAGRCGARRSGARRTTPARW